MILVILVMDDEAYNWSPLAAVYLGKLEVTHSDDIHGVWKKYPAINSSQHHLAIGRNAEGTGARYTFPSTFCSI